MEIAIRVKPGEILSIGGVSYVALIPHSILAVDLHKDEFQVEYWTDVREKEWVSIKDLEERGVIKLMTFLSVTEETLEALNLLRWQLGEGEDDDSLIRRIVEYARCYMVIWGAEGSEEKPRLRPPLLEVVKDFVLSRRSDIEKDMENFGALKPVLNYFLEEASG